MPADRNKISVGLSAAELQEFIARCAATKELTLAKIQKLAADRGITISLMSAKAFRDSTFERHLQRLRKARELAEQVAEFSEQGVGHTLADAGAVMLSQQLVDLLSSPPDQWSPKDAASLAKAISTLRSGNVQVAAMQQKIREHEERAARMKTALEKVKKQNGLSADALAQIEEAAKLL